MRLPSVRWRTQRSRLAHIAREFLPQTAPRVQAIRYHLADCKLDLQQADGEVAQLLADLDPGTLMVAQQESDWEGLLQYQRGRLSLLQGRPAEARESLSKALQIITECDPSGVISPRKIRALLDGLPTMTGGIK
jgi:hypothetical protein